MGYTYSGGVDLGAEAAFAYNEERLRWFDRWLKDADDSVDADPTVRIFVMGGGDGRMNRAGRMNHGGHWREEQEWPLNRAKATPFYIHPNGSLLTEPPKETDASTTYRFDPDDPVPTIGGNISSLARVRPVLSYIMDPATLPQAARVEQIVANGGWDQREREDVLGATLYAIYIKHNSAINPATDLSDLPTSQFNYNSPSGYVADADRFGWDWKVRAFVNGEWGPWSVEREFSVEPVNTDCP